MKITTFEYLRNEIEGLQINYETFKESLEDLSFITFENNGQSGRHIDYNWYTATNNITKESFDFYVSKE